MSLCCPASRALSSSFWTASFFAVASLASSKVFRGSKTALVEWGKAAPVATTVGQGRIGGGQAEASFSGTGEAPRLGPGGKVVVSDEWAKAHKFEDPAGIMTPSAYFAFCQEKNSRARQMVD